MKLLLDQNLSRHLIGQLRDVFPGSQHVTKLGLDAATDREVWEYAPELDYIVVPKDSDFRQLSTEGGVASRGQCVDGGRPPGHPRPRDDHRGVCRR